jgi:YVTN family beta-propeller protein
MAHCLCRRSLAILALTALVAVVLWSTPACAIPFAYVGDGNVPGHLDVIDVATSAIVAQISIGDETNCCQGPQAIAVSPSGDRAYMATSNSGALWVLDTATNTFITRIPLDGTWGVAINPAATRIYVSGYGSNKVYVLNALTNTLITTIPVPGGPRGIVVSPDGAHVYTVNFSGNSVSTIDTATNTVVASVPIPDGPFGTSNPQDIVITPNGARLFVTKTNTYEIVVIDPATNSIVTHVNTQNGPTGIAINPAGTRVYVGHSYSATIKVIDTATNTVVDSIPSESNGGMSLTPDGSRLYACKNNFPSQVHVIDTATNAVLTDITGLRPYAFGNFIGPVCPSACNDGNPCTTDGCNQVSGCIYTNNTGPCASDGNSCTQDVCDGAGACTHPDLTAGTSCDDGLFCDGADTCDGAGGCVNHAGDPCTAGAECAQTCNEGTDDCFAVATTPCTADGNVCTDDHCDGVGACIHPANSAPCDDGSFCDGADTCAGGSCSLHAGDPCTGGPECANACNETLDSCLLANGTPCTSDGNPCSLDTCDGAGACAHTAGNAGTTCRSATGQCDAAETCTGASTACPPDLHQPDGTGCSDGDSCTNPDVCTGGVCTSGTPVVCPLCQTCDSVGGCLVGPRSGCKHPTAPLKASLYLKDQSPDDMDQAKWKWSSGAATTFAELGNPLATDDYALCVYDATSQLLLEMTAPAGGTCGTKPCWKQLGPPTLPKGFKYKDVDGLPNDLDALALKAGVDGKAKMSLKGKGANIPMPALGSFALPLTTQLQSGNGQCYEATMSTPSVNTSLIFKSKSD